MGVHVRVFAVFTDRVRRAGVEVVCPRTGVRCVHRSGTPCGCGGCVSAYWCSLCSQIGYAVCVWRLCVHVRVFAVFTDRVRRACVEVVCPRTGVRCVHRSGTPCGCGGCVSAYGCSLCSQIGYAVRVWRLCVHVLVFAVFTDRVRRAGVEVVCPRTCVCCLHRSGRRRVALSGCSSRGRLSPSQPRPDLLSNESHLS